MIKDDVGYLTSPHAQHVDVPRQQVVVMAPQNISGEEIGAAWAPSATIIRHGELSGCYESSAMPSVIAPYAGFQSSLTLLVGGGGAGAGGGAAGRAAAAGAGGAGI